MAVTKRIFQLSKEFGRDEKEIIAFLTTQGIKVSNRLSAVSEETYNLLKEKFMAPPEPEPEPAPAPAPEPAPAPAVKEEKPAEPATAPAKQPQPPQGDKKKKKKNKAPQAAAAETPPQEGQPATPEEKPEKEVTDLKIENMNKRTRTILFEGIMAGNNFIQRYSQNSGQTPLNKQKKPMLTADMDAWGILFNHKVENSDSPMRYWESVSKLMTRAFKIINGFGLANREALAAMRDAMAPIGGKYQPREAFTPEENKMFEAQQRLLFRTFGHGMGLVNDNLYALKMKADRMKARFEYMDFLSYVTNPEDELRSNERVPFNELIEAVAHSARSIVRRFNFYNDHKERIDNIIKKFFEWIDGYAKLKESGATVAKLEKYLELEEKFIDIVEFMSFDNNLVDSKKEKKGAPSPFDTLVDLLEAYRDNLDDPDAERNFKYKVRGVINIIYKPKEYSFTYQFGGLESNKDYRPPEEIAAARAAAKVADPAAEVTENVEASEVVEKENPAEKQ